MFKFPVHPAQLTVGEGARAAWDLLVRTWEVWVPVAIVLGIAQTVLSAAAGHVAWSQVYSLDTSTNTVVFASDASSKLSGLLFVAFFAAVVSLVGTWFFTAAAIVGLRGRPLDAGWVMISGLKTLAAGLVLLLLFFAGFIVLAIVLGAIPPLGALLFLASIPLLVYLAIRLAFLELAIFDGAGVVEGIREAVRLSGGAVLRLFGWGLVFLAIAILAGIVSGIIAGVFRSASSEVADGVSAGLNGILSCFGVYFLAAVYESQRARRNAEYAPPAGVAPPEFNDPWSAPR